MASNRCRSATTVGIARARPLPRREPRQLLGDDRLGARDLGAAPREVLLDDALQVVDVVEEHLLDLAHRRIDVARHGDVDDEQRVGAPAPGHRLDVVARDDRPLRPVAVMTMSAPRERVPHLRPGHGAAADLRRQRLGVRGRAAGDHDLGRRPGCAGAARSAR